MGHVIISGGSRMTMPITGTRAGDLAVGTVVKLNEGGTNVDFLVVNQGIPSNSSLYDASCDGTWLLRKDIKENRAWNSGNVNEYESSPINTWLNNDYFEMFGTIEKNVIKQIKIPYRSYTVANGLLSKIFLLSIIEAGVDKSYLSTDDIGAKLDYFKNSDTTDPKRIAYLNGVATDWWTRSSIYNTLNYVYYIVSNGYYNNTTVLTSLGIRPALILPKTAIFDSDTLVLKGG